MSKGDVVVGVLAGVAVGAILGILFAPDKGSVTREKLSEKGKDTVDDLKDKFDDFLAILAESLDAATVEANPNEEQ